MKHLIIAFTFLFCLVATVGRAQISSSADGTASTQYASGTQDQIFIFCTTPGGAEASLTASSVSGSAANFEWFRYDETAGSFQTYQVDNSGRTFSTISGLQDGGYRVVVTVGAETETYTSWVFNSWYAVSAEITESDCDYLQLVGRFDEANFTYTDLNAGGSLSLNKNVQVRWEANSTNISSLLSPAIYFPPVENTTYQITVFDDFGCSGQATVFYQSIVPEAIFTADPTSGEGPLEVTFTNQSRNADEYEWFFFRDREEIREEAASNGEVSDSIMDTAINDSPVYTFEDSGNYMVKLVATKNSSTTVCRDTVYLDNYIEVSESMLDAPNFMTPNGDESNDNFQVIYRSMRSMNVKIFNRWGKLIHSFDRDNLGEFAEGGSEVAWNGEIGGKLASPGVYYYVIEATGRDDVKYKKQGFFHLFREK